jgi:GTP-binding protein EngB required for normal cell division
LSMTIGFRGYSLMLRNCEHISNYIMTGRWISEQVYNFKNLLDIINKTEYKRLINTPPYGLKGDIYDVREEKIQSVSRFTLKTDSFTEPPGLIDMKTVLLIGPTGSGKSRIIESLFDLSGLSTTSLNSVTSDVIFYSGNYSTDKNHNNLICVIDTVGLCDSTLSHVDVTSLLVNRIHRCKIDLVLLCLSSSARLSGPEREAIDRLMSYLQDADVRIVFTKCDQVSEADLLKIKSEVKLIYPSHYERTVVVENGFESFVDKVFDLSLREPVSMTNKEILDKLMLTTPLKDPLIITLNCWDAMKSKMGF